MQKDKFLSPSQVKEIKDFIDKNSYSIHQYINTNILQDIGKMNYDYFLKVVKNIFSENIQSNKYTTNYNLIPYFLFTLIEKKGKIDYTSLRLETIDFNLINKEAMVYYNYVQFSLEDNFLYIKLMQTKMGGMPLDKDLVKFIKKVPIKTSGLKKFINQVKITK